MIEMIIDSLRAGLVNPNVPQQGTPYIVMLKEKNGDRYLPIFIGQFEAHVIALKLNHEETPRPLTHDVLSTIIDTLGGNLDSVVISDLRNETFFAKINIDTAEGSVSIDTRPSDAIALALSYKTNDVKIFVEDSVLEKTGIPVDREGVSPNINPNRIDIDKLSKNPKNTKASQDEIGNLSAYSDFLDSLNLDDFGEDN